MLDSMVSVLHSVDVGSTKRLANGRDTMTDLQPNQLIPWIRGNTTLFMNAEGQILGCLMGGKTVSAHGCNETFDVSSERPCNRYYAARMFIVKNARI